MRRLAILLPLALSACEREKSFDERYEIAQDEIESKAKELDRELTPSPSPNHVTTKQPVSVNEREN